MAHRAGDDGAPHAPLAGLPVDAADIAWLRSEAGAAAIARAAAWLDAGTTELAAHDRLRREVAPEQARAVLALLEGRRAAAAKFPDAARLCFDREAAEQASAEAVARHTARRFAGARRIADLGCGGGGDALALAAHAPVLAIDLDAARLAMVEANAAARGLEGRVETRLADAGTFDAHEAGVDAIWLDPARRDAGGRLRDPETWSPPLSVALRVAASVPRAGVKAAPGLDLAAAPAGAEVEFVSLDGTLVEAVIWLGEAVTAPRRATVLATGGTVGGEVGGEVATVAGEPDTGATPLRDPAAYLYDLDPGVGRASLVDAVAPLLRGGRLDERTAYLTGDAAVTSPFARRFRIDAWLPFSERRLRDALVRLGAGRVEVMRRASPVDTNALEARLNRQLAGATGGPVRTVALTRLQGAHIAIICEREAGSTLGSPAAGEEPR